MKMNPQTWEAELLRFNPRRAARGAPAAEVKLTVAADGWEDILWMDETDIRLNIRELGMLPGLLAAMQAYKTREEFPVRQ